MKQAPKEIQENFEMALSDINIFNWSLSADRFYIGNSTVYLTNIGGREIHIETRAQMDGKILWVVKMDSWVLGKDSEYHYEPMPSSRTDGFIAKTRFFSKEKALEALIKHEVENNSKEIPQLTVPSAENR